jgi:tRNA pseudouridine55 synthase
MARAYRALDGVLLFDKPLELSSNTALQKVRHLFQAAKAGHTGTLDPLATGLLPVCFGEATKFSTALLDADKTYRALIRLGQATTTGDAEGQILSQCEVDVTQSQVDEALQKFRGDIRQIPPMYSALKHQGKPLYEYVRQGETIERAPREVVIYELTQHAFTEDTLDISVRCSKGTYIRTLAEDIGAELGCGAHLLALRRTAIAHFDLGTSCTLPQLAEMSETERDARILPLEALMPNLLVLQLDDTQAKRIAQGQRLALDTGLPDGKVRLHGLHGFIGTGLLQGRRLAPDRLLSNVAKHAAQAPEKADVGLEQ